MSATHSRNEEVNAIVIKLDYVKEEILDIKTNLYGREELQRELNRLERRIENLESIVEEMR